MPSISHHSRPYRLRLFAAELVRNGFKAQQAILSIGLTKNPNSAAVIANRLLNDVRCDAAINEVLMQKKMSAEDVLTRLTDIANKDVTFSGSDVVKSNELLGKFHKLFTDKIETSSSDSPISSVLLDKIKSCASSTGISENQAAIQLYQTLSNWGSSHADPANFGPFQADIEAHIAGNTEEIREVSDAEQ
jgi:hypothetical protein